MLPAIKHVAGDKFVFQQDNAPSHRANAQRDGRPAEHRWRPLFNAAVWLTA